MRKDLLLKIFFIFFLVCFLVKVEEVLAEANEDMILERCKEVKKHFPNLNFTEIRKAPIPDMCELWVGTNVIYYHPKKRLLFFGEIWTIEGKSLTQEARYKMIISRISKLDLSKAIRWGTGPVKVILFVDPECPHCKRLEKMLFTSLLEQDITAYIFLYPLSSKTKKYAETILCAPDPVEKLLAFASGNITEKDKEPSSECREKVKEQLNAMIAIGKSLNISGTPFLIIEDEIISGADLPRIFQTIAKKKAEKTAQKK